MITDLNLIPSEQIRTTDVCIVGGGVAGITLALQLAKNQKLNIVILESGSEKFESDSQSLYKGSQSGKRYYDLETSRIRMLGGTSNHWGGNCRQFSPIDFKQRDWVQNSGWPIDYDELEEYYKKAANYLKISSEKMDVAENWAGDNLESPKHSKLTDISITQFAPETTGVNHFTALSFGKAYGETLRQLENVELIFHANLTDVIKDNKTAKIRKVRAKSLSGKELTIGAKQFVLATGGIENARILLHQDIGNERDNVGRYFMEHLAITLGVMVPSLSKLARYDMFATPNRRMNLNAKEQVRTIGYYTFSEETQKKEKLLSGCITVKRQHSSPMNSSVGFNSLRTILSNFKSGAVPDAFHYHLRNVLVNLDDIGVGVYQKIAGKKQNEELFNVHIQAEQEPNRKSRVTLAKETDSLGIPKSNLNWALTERDLLSLRESAKVISRELGAAGLGRMNINLHDDNAVLEEELVGDWHHMGTTRMSDNPESGVVDKHCKVFSLDNLYIAGSSVFPTGGHSVPTFTIVALTLRLADHLESQLL